MCFPDVYEILWGKLDKTENKEANSYEDCSNL